MVGDIEAILDPVAAWAKLNTVKAFSDGVPDGYKLIYVNPVWRHGDRASTKTFPGDVLHESDWDFGGGGYGELSPIGMRQHFQLGRMLYDRYADKNQFLSSRYRAEEIYVHSTDSNRTLVSAMSNFAGMYSRPTALRGTDYPEDADEWPQIYVPVPIHTSYKPTDHIGDPDAPCSRRSDLWKLAHQHPEYIEYDNREMTQQTLQYLQDATHSGPDDVNFDNIYRIRGGIYCETIHFPDNVSTWYPWYTDDVRQSTEAINNQNIDFENGIYKSGMIDGYDLTVEVPTLRGGPLINHVLERALGMLDCWDTNNVGEKTRCTDSDHFLNRLKYYVISAHDTTVAAYLTVLEAKPSVLTSGGYPSYSSAVINEFFVDTKTMKRKFRILFHDDENTSFRVITPFVTGCSEDFCDIEHFVALADKYAPTGGIEELCKKRVHVPSGQSTTSPPSSTEKTSEFATAPTTKNPVDNGVSTPVTVATIPSTTSSTSLISFISTVVVVLFSCLLC